MKNQWFITSGTAVCACAVFVLAAQGQSPPDHTPPGQRTPGESPRQTPPTKPGTPGTVDDAVRRGYVAIPPGSEPLAAEIGAGTIVMFKDQNFKGTQGAATAITASAASGQLKELPNDLPDSLSSVQWNLPPGIVVILFEDAAGKGEQLALWGKGQMSDLTDWGYNDKASRWSWYNVGAGDSAGPGATIGPHGSRPTSASVPERSVVMHEDKNFDRDTETVTDITTHPAGQLHNLPGDIKDELTSMRWNLPAGVIVLLYEDAGGEENQVAVWGLGEVADLDVWDFNDKVSRWAWAYVGTPHKLPPPSNPDDPANHRPGRTPPSGPDYPPGTGNPNSPQNPSPPTNPPTQP
jgi:hypothetical protein